MFELSWSVKALYGYFNNENLKLHENSPEDIEEAVVEYMDLLISQNYNRSRLQNEAHDTRAKTYYKFCNNTQYPGLTYEDKMIEKWRLSTKITGSNGAICQKFLEKYWN